MFRSAQFTVQCNAQSVAWHRIAVTLSATCLCSVLMRFFRSLFIFLALSITLASGTVCLMKIPSVAYKLAVFRVISCKFTRPKKATYTHITIIIMWREKTNINIFIRILASRKHETAIQEKTNEWMNARRKRNELELLLHFRTDYYAFFSGILGHRSLFFELGRCILNI